MQTRSMILGAMGVLALAMFSHAPRRALAAPPAAQRATPAPLKPSAGNARPGAVASPLVVNAKVLQVASRCGESIQSRVRLTNKTNATWTGAIEFGGVTTPVKLFASGSASEWSYDLRAGKIDCTKPLGVVPLKVTKSAGVGPALLVNQVLKPSTVAATEHLDHAPGPPSHGKLRLRELNVSGNCGGVVVGSARFEQHPGGGSPAPGGAGTAVGDTGARLRLKFGDKAQVVVIGGATSGPSMTDLMLQFGIPGASFDCATGFPALEYAVVGGGGKVVETNGTLSSYMVTFAP